MRSDPPISVLFVCTGNAGRSQMAHALFRRRHARELDSGRIRVASAGVDPWPHLHPLAVQLMAERGISMDDHHPKGVDAVPVEEMELVVTIGDPARSLFPRDRVAASRWIHWAIDDPADADGTAHAEATFRATLQAIEQRLPGLDPFLARAAATRTCALRPGIGTGILGKAPLRPAEHLPTFRRAGFRNLELNLYKGTEHFDGASASAVTEFRQVAAAEGLAVWSVHSPDIASVASPLASERQCQMDALRLAVDVACQLGARVVVSHALLLGPFAEDPEGCESRLDAFLQEANTLVEPLPVRLAFENAGFAAPPGAQTGRLLQRLQATSPAACGFVLDTGHSNIDGDWECLEQAADPRLISLHLNDNDGASDAHLPPLAGTAPWQRIRALIGRTGYRGALLYEVEPHGDLAVQLARTMTAHGQLFGAAAG